MHICDLKGIEMSLRLTSSALALMTIAAPAFADVTPEEVWQNWLDYFKTSGYEVTEGNREKAGATLTVSDVAFVFGDESAKVTFTVPEIVMQETGDGGVRTTYTDQQDVQINGKNADGEDFATTLHLSYPGNEMVTSGDADDMTHTYTYPELVLAVKEVTSKGETKPLPIEAKLTGSKGFIHAIKGDQPRWDVEHKSETVAVNADIDSPEAMVKIGATLETLALTGSMTAAQGMTLTSENLATALNEGLTMEGRFAYGPTKGTFEFTGKGEQEGQTGNGTFEAGNGDLFYQMSRDGMTYQGNGGAVKAEVAMMPLPFPIRYALESSHFDLQMPISKSDDAQPFKLAYSLAGLTINDEVWDLFDPTRKLSRDPANIDLDLEGQTKVTADLMDPATMETLDAADDTAEDPMAGSDETVAVPQKPSPFELIDLTVNQLAIKAVGANIEATGNLKPSEENGMDQPVGKLNVRFSGVAELAQTLAQMGLLPPDQVMMVNAMIGTLSVEDPDQPGSRKSEIEMKEDGSVFANGQQMQ